MVKEINLAKSIYDSNVGTLADNDTLQIKINGKTYQNAKYYLKAKNGTKVFDLLFNDGAVEIPREELAYGLFKAKVVAMVDNTVVREFNIEDLLLKEVDGEIKVVPELEQVKNEFEALKQEYKELAEKFIEIQKLCENTKKLVLKLNAITQKVGV